MTHYLITQTETGVVLGCIEAEDEDRAWATLCADIGADPDERDSGIAIEDIADTEVCVAVQRTESGTLEIDRLTTDTILDWDQVEIHHEARGELDSLLTGWDPWTALYRVIDADDDEYLYARALSDTAVVRAVRSKLGLTQRELARALGVSRRAVQYWEAGVRTPDVRTQLALEYLLLRQGD